MSRAKALRDKNIVAKLVKDLNNKMSSFECAVDELKILKDSISEMHDEVTAQEVKNSAVLSQLKAELKDNKTKLLNDAADEMGKVIISKEELKELKNEVLKMKSSNSEIKSSTDALVTQKVEELMQHRLKLQELEHLCAQSKLTAENETFKKEIENLEKSFTRMTQELESQKKLTANLALASRPSTNNVTSSV